MNNLSEKPDVSKSDAPLRHAAEDTSWEAIENLTFDIIEFRRKMRAKARTANAA